VTIRRGQEWGSPGALPAGAVIVRSDKEARAAVEGARRSGAPVPVLGLLGGDLARTLGGRGDEARLHSPDARHVPIDVGSVLLDGRQFWFVAHMVARRSWWRGRVVAAMNAQYLGDWDVAPRTHPNDGRLDLLDVDPAFGFTDRMKARRRLPRGAHLPHPGIVERRVTAWQVTFTPALRVWLDGEPMGAVKNVSLRVEPDALTVVV
jgi:diacylglycerol kinase family enzyme